MALTLICPDKDPAPWIRALNDADPKLEIRVWPDDHPREEIELALTWSHPWGCLTLYPNLGCISSMGAGVDHLLSDPDLPGDIPLVRIIDSGLVSDMAEYILLAVLSHFRQFDIYHNRQSHQDWHPLAPLDKKDFSIGIMGLGQLGRAAAQQLISHGFSVTGWKNSSGTIPGIPSFYGKEQLFEFLSQTRVLICLLPLTQATCRILNSQTFSRLARESYLINVGRGKHLDENALIPALDRGLLSGACLDVFDKEPLEPGHPFWSHPKIKITPHISSLTHPASVAPQIIENLKRLRTGRPLLNLVDPQKGY
ncbi:MAG: glyoxylate/hydroxypyruvate reductase A [Desulfobacter sp.]|nr:MAG: glyoxylate/hydroxypyruvate reductase A [Desulfobacter sp.]